MVLVLVVGADRVERVLEDIDAQTVVAALGYERDEEVGVGERVLVKRMCQ